MIEARDFTSEQIANAYDRRSWIYSETIARMEFKNHLRALEHAAIQSGEQVLEVAVGPGKTLLEIAKRVGLDTTVHGVDVSRKMLAIARGKLLNAGHANLNLRVGDARKLPFPTATFDVLYNGYMLDLIPLADIPTIMTEFSRVLKPGGRLVLLNMSRRDSPNINLYETLYIRLPASLVLNFMGACRPVLMEGPAREAGFSQVKRQLIVGIIPSEIIVGFKP